MPNSVKSWRAKQSCVLNWRQTLFEKRNSDELISTRHFPIFAYLSRRFIDLWAFSIHFGRYPASFLPIYQTVFTYSIYRKGKWIIVCVLFQLDKNCGCYGNWYFHTYNGKTGYWQFSVSMGILRVFLQTWSLSNPLRVTWIWFKSPIGCQFDVKDKFRNNIQTTFSQKTIRGGSLT